MSTLASLIDRPLHELSETELESFIEQLRSVRQTHQDTAYETRATRRKTASASKKKPLEVTATMLEKLDSIDINLDI